MKKLLALASVICLLASLAAAQGNNPAKTFDKDQVIQLPLLNPPQPVIGGSAQRGSGNPGPRTLYYWVVTTNIIGASTPAGPFQINSAPNVLNGSNTVKVSWVPVADGVSYDVLRSSSPLPPSGTCNCAVATGVTTGSATDSSESLSAYTVAPIDPAAYMMTLTNEGTASTQSQLALHQGGNLLGYLTPGGGPSGGGLQGYVTAASNALSLQSYITTACSASPIKGLYIPADRTGDQTFTNTCNAPVIKGSRIGDARGGRISVLDFGADPSGGYYPAATMNSGASTISINATGFWANPGLKAGNTVCMSAAGPAGADLCGHVVSYSSGTITTDVTASTTASGRGVWWGTDNQAAFQAAVNLCSGQTYAPNGGCEIDVPPGQYILHSTVTFPAVNGNNAGRISFKCIGGRLASKFIWSGADQGDMFQGPTGSVPMEFNGCDFASADSYVSYPTSGRAGIGVHFLGGTQHRFIDNRFENLYEGLRGTSSWLNLVDHNVFYGPYNAAIHWYNGGVAPINATTVSNNEFGSYGLYGLLSDSSNAGGSNGNFYFGNDFEGTTSITIADVDLNDNWGSFGPNRFETSGSTVPGWQAMILRGTYNNIQVTFCGSGMTITGTDNQITCSWLSGAITDTGGFNTYRAGIVRSTNLTGPGSASAVIFGTRRSGTILDAPFFQMYSQGQPDNPNGSPSFRISSDLVSATVGMILAPTLSYSTPTVPRADTGAVFNVGDIIRAADTGYAPGSPRNNVLLWECIGSTAATCTFDGTNWGRTGALYRSYVYSMFHGEASTIPASGTHATGDWFWNSAPIPGTTALPTIVGWINTAGGTPGTYKPVYAIDPSNPPDWGTSSRAAGSFTQVVVSSTGITPNTLCSGQCTLAWWFKADSLGLGDGASVTSLTDSAAGAHNASCAATQPIFKTNIFAGKPVVRFTQGTTSSCTTSAFSVTGPYTVFFVASHPTGIPTPQQGLIFGNNGNTYFWPIAADTNLRIQNNGGTAGYPNFAATVVDDGKQHVVSNVMQTSATGNSIVVFDGATVGSVSAASQLDFLTSHTLTISSTVASGFSFGGDVAEIIVYQGALSDSDRKKIEQYLGAKWGIPATSRIIDVQNPSGASLANFDANGKMSANGAVQGLSTLAFSATPQFDFTATNTIKMTLTGAVTSSTLVGATAGQPLRLILCQDATGGWTMSWPVNVTGAMTIGSTASKCNAQEFIFDGTNAVATSPGVTNQ